MPQGEHWPSRGIARGRRDHSRSTSSTAPSGNVVVAGVPAPQLPGANVLTRNLFRAGELVRTGDETGSHSPAQRWIQADASGGQNAVTCGYGLRRTAKNGDLFPNTKGAMLSQTTYGVQDARLTDTTLSAPRVPQEAKAALAEVAEGATAVGVPLHLRIDRELDAQLRRRAAEAHVPTSAAGPPAAPTGGLGGPRAAHRGRRGEHPPAASLARSCTARRARQRRGMDRQPGSQTGSQLPELARIRATGFGPR